MDVALMQVCEREEVYQVGGEAKVMDTLSRVFGFQAFRPEQREIVDAILAGRDAFVVMPTGGGKSLCYQLPARLLPGTCVVISPLISLMKDQVDAASATGLRAAYLNSSQSVGERGGVLRLLEEGELDLIYISPERYAMASFVKSLQKTRISFFAIDEAHCISEWGHDFRADYLHLSQIILQFPRIPVAAFTATATTKVAGDIVRRLGLRDPFKVRASFNRANLYYEVVPKRNVNSQLLDFVKSRAGQAGIIYRTTRADVEGSAAFLAANGVKAVPYHAGLDERVRRDNQDAFNRDAVDVVVATIAFGMGIDKSNVRYVLHGDLPKNIEGYYQETGRAGRDGEPAHCLLLYGPGDMGRIRWFIDKMTDPQQRSHALACLQAMSDLASIRVCRRRQLLAYFNEAYPETDCGTCDVCTEPVEMEDATSDAQKILSTIHATRQRFGVNHLIDIVMGANTEKIRKFGHQKLPTYGRGQGRDKGYWRRVINGLLAKKIIRRSDDQYPTLKLMPGAGDLLAAEGKFEMVKESARPARHARKTARTDYHADLFEELRRVRRQCANQMGVPAFVVFSDRTLREMAHYLPISEAEFRTINGVSETKCREFGGDFLPAIRGYVQRHPGLERPLVVAVASGQKLGGSQFTTLAYLKQGLTVEEISEKRGFTARTISGHICDLIEEGQEVDIDRFIDCDRRQEIEALFSQHDTGLLGPIVEATNDDVSYDEARVVRAWLQRKRDRV